MALARKLEAALEAQKDPEVERIKEHPLYKHLGKIFDKSMTAFFDREAKRFNNVISKVEKKIIAAETRMLLYCEQTKTIANQEILMAETLVNKELRFKTIMSQWTNAFISATSDARLDALSWGFSRFCLNIAMGWNEIPPRALIQAGIHKSLCDLIKFRSELVIGPALMALCHISFHEELKPAITMANVLPTLIKLLVTCESKPILLQTCKLLASLALHFPNKVLITNSGNVHGLLDCILGTNKEIDDQVAHAALQGIVNVVNGNDANRNLMVDLNGVKPILSILQQRTEPWLLIECTKALGNIGYCNPFTAGTMLSLGADKLLVELLNGDDILTQPDIVFTALATFANLCYNESTQSHIGSSPNLVETVIRVLHYGKHLLCVGEAAMCLVGVMWKNRGNKILVAGKGAIPVLVDRICLHWDKLDEENIDCLEKCCAAVATCLIYKTNLERFYVVNGLERLVDISKKSGTQRVVAAISQILVCCVPCPTDLVRWHDDEFTVPAEKFGVLPVLKKAKFVGFGHLPEPPDWLQTAVVTLQMSDANLRIMPVWEKAEFIERLRFCKEFTTEILPDVDTMSNASFKGLLFSVY
jgi:hypothetical protein